MLDLLDKASMYVAIMVLGYLAYSAVGQRKGFVNEGKELPVLTKAMLRPDFIEPKGHASPVGRDPFMVSWDLYSEGALSRDRAGLSADAETGYSAGAGPDAKLMAVITTGDGHNAALIDGVVYEVGSYLKRGSIKTAWKIERIRPNQVVLEHNGVKHVLTIATGSAFFPNPADIEKKDLGGRAGTP